MTWTPSHLVSDWSNPVSRKRTQPLLSSELLYQMCAVCRSRHLVNVYEVNPVRLIQSLCAVCGSNLAELNPSVYSFCCVPPCVADFGVDCAVCHESNKRRLLLLLL